MHPLTTLFSLAFDSFLASCLLGMISMSWQQRVYLACAFGAWDALGSTLGMMLPHSPEAALASFALAAWLYIEAVKPATKLYFALPILCSLDNLLTGASTPTPPLMIAASSATLAMLGLFVGARIRMIVSPFAKGRVVPHRTSRVV